MKASSPYYPSPPLYSAFFGFYFFTSLEFFLLRVFTVTLVERTALKLTDSSFCGFVVALN
jgi:hypothetical protein